MIGVEGTMRLRHEWIVRFSYGKIRPWVRRRTAHGQEVITAVAGPDKLILRGPRLPRAEDGHHVDEFEVTAGQELTFSTTWTASHKEIPELLEFDE
ncbi:MAG TPA: glycoside hydrolase family 15 protein, partial [Nocardioidaceae bacterium]|nr:glycoside hydrolase family 15 protein [Nocardioidaceae bacterium]